MHFSWGIAPFLSVGGEQVNRTRRAGTKKPSAGMRPEEGDRNRGTTSVRLGIASETSFTRSRAHPGRSTGARLHPFGVLLGEVFARVCPLSRTDRKLSERPFARGTVSRLCIYPNSITNSRPRQAFHQNFPGCTWRQCWRRPSESLGHRLEPRDSSFAVKHRQCPTRETAVDGFRKRHLSSSPGKHDDPRGALLQSEVSPRMQRERRTAVSFDR